MAAQPCAPDSAAPVKLRLANVSKSFQAEEQTIEALKPISSDIAEGEYVVLFGPSGCGKSTLLNLVAGFERPDAGEITLDGQPISGPGSDRLMMFQEHALFPWLKVLDNVSYGLRWQARLSFPACVHENVRRRSSF